MSQKTVIGVFESPEEARRASEELSREGYPRERVDVASRPGSYSDASYDTEDREKHKGSAIGRFFRNLFSDNDDEADRYSRVADRSGSVVTVHCHDNDNAEHAAEILDRCGAVDVDERASKYGFYSSVGRTNMSSDRGLEDTGTMRTDMTGEESRSIPVVKEEMQVNKQEVQTGGARLRSRIVEHPVEENLRLREEHVFVERKPVNRPANESDMGAFREGTIELRESAEVPVVNKESRVVEEVSLGKKVEEREETIRGTVRNTEVDIERLDGDRTNLNNSGRSNMSSDDSDLNDRGRTGFDPDMPGRGI